MGVQTEQLMTKAQAAYFLNIGVRTLESWMSSKRVDYYASGKTVRFSKEQLLAAMQKNNAQSPAVSRNVPHS